MARLARTVEAGREKTYIFKTASCVHARAHEKAGTGAALEGLLGSQIYASKFDGSL